MRVAQSPSALRSEASATLRLAVPLMVAQSGTMAMGVTDTAMLGRLGAEPLAAAALSNALFGLPLLFGFGLLSALGPMMSGALGAQSVRRVGPLLGAGAMLALLIGLFAVLILQFAEPVLHALGQPSETVPAAASYLSILCLSIPLANLFMVLRHLLSAHGRVRAVLIVTWVGVLANGLFNYALIFGNLGMPALGLEGAAIGTVLAHGLSLAVLLAVALRRSRYVMYVRRAVSRAALGALREVVRIGLPSGIIVLAEVSLFASAALIVGLFGSTALAAHGIALQLISVAFMLPLGLSHATAIRVGRAAGRGRREEARRAGLVSVTLTVGLMCLSGLIFLTLPGLLIGLLTGAGGVPQVTALAAQMLFVAALFQIVDGLQIVLAAALRGLRDTFTPMLIALGSYSLIGLPTSWLLAVELGVGATGVWMGLATGLSVAALALGLRFLSLLRAWDRVSPAGATP